MASWLDPGDFGFGEDHEILREGARRFLAEHCPMDAVRRLAADPVGYDPGTWKELAQLGWTGLTVPEAHGGAGLGHLHQVLLLEEMGRRLLPAPYLGTVLATLALRHAGDDAQQARWLPAVARGEAVATLAWVEAEGAWEPGAVAARAEPDGTGWRLSGVKPHVLAGGRADWVVAPFRAPDGVALFCVERGTPGLATREEVCVDPTRRTARLAFEAVRVDGDARLAAAGGTAWRRTLLEGAAWLAAEMVGTAEGVLAMTRDYAVERKQFGRQIGSFQGVKHPLVDDLVGVETARTLVLAAAAGFDRGDPAADVVARMAKAHVSDVLTTAARHGVQFHGGYGFTIDCDVHFYLKRGLFMRGMLGDAVHHRRHLARALFDDDEATDPPGGARRDTTGSEAST